MSGFSKINIEFCGHVPEQFHDADTLKGQLELYHREPCTIQIVDYNHNGLGTVSFEFYAGSMVHVDWQVKLLVHYLRTVHEANIDEISATGYQESDYGSCYYNQETFEEEEIEDL